MYMWLRKRLQPIFDLFLPFHAIARELALLRELYELELAEMGIRRLTETPGKSDTEVSYADDPVKKKSALADLMNREEEEEEDV